MDEFKKLLFIGSEEISSPYLHKKFSKRIKYFLIKK